MNAISSPHARAILASARLQLLMVAKRPMNIATGVVTPWLFLSLFLLPRLGTLHEAEVTHAVSSSMTAS